MHTKDSLTACYRNLGMTQGCLLMFTGAKPEVVPQRLI